MTIRDRIFGKKEDNTIKWLDDQGRPKTVIASGKALTGGDSGGQERSEKLLNAYWDYYSGDGTIFAALNTTAWNTVMVGYELISDNEDAKLLIETYAVISEELKSIYKEG